MLLKARDVCVGHYIMDYGKVQSVHVLDNEVAATGETHSEKPKLRGRLLSARLEAEAEEQCYNRVPGSIVFAFVNGKNLSRRPDDQVQVVAVDLAAKVYPRPAA